MTMFSKIVNSESEKPTRKADSASFSIDIVAVAASYNRLNVSNDAGFNNAPQI